MQKAEAAAEQIGSQDANKSGIANFSVSLHFIAHQMGQENGLKYHDYERYRSYCSRRLMRLRSSLEFKQGRNRYVGKALPVAIPDKRFLLIPLIQAERAWSHGMQLKTENATVSEINLRIRAHAIRKFSKAVQYAKLLEGLCHSTFMNTAENEQPSSSHLETKLCDTKTCTEATAYRLNMENILCQEKEQWAEATVILQKLQQNYSHLRRVSSTMTEQEQVFKQKLEALEPQLRLCQFHAGELYDSAMDSTISSKTTQKKVGTSGSTLAAKCTDQAWVWHGEVFDVKSEKPRQALIAAISLMKQTLIVSTDILCQLKDSAVSPTVDQIAATSLVTTPHAEWTESYGQVVAKFHACVDLIHSEIMAKPDDPTWAHSEGYCLDLARCIQIERDALLLLKVMAANYKSVGINKSLPGRESAEGFRFSSLLLQSCGRLNQDESLREADSKRILRWVQYIKDAKAICLAISKACEGQMAEAYVLSNAIASRQSNYSNEPQAPEEEYYLRLHFIFIIVKKFTTAIADMLKCKAICSLIKAEHGLEDIGKSMQSSTTIEKEQILSVLGRTLMQPPTPIGCKPQLFDLAIVNLPPPDISSRIGNERGTIGKLIKSWWAR